MKLRMISENRIVDLFKQLDKHLMGISEEALEGIVEDPKCTMTLIKKGASSREFILQDKHWLREFLGQWHLLDSGIIMEIFEEVYEDTVDRIEKSKKKENRTENGKQHQSEQWIRQELVLSEGIGGFLSKLAKWMILFVQILTTISGNGAGRGGKNSGGIYDINSYAIYNLTQNLYEASRQKLERQADSN